MLRAVLDPNVLVSSVLTPRGVGAQALQARRDRCAIIACPLLIDELADVVQNPNYLVTSAERNRTRSSK